MTGINGAGILVKVVVVQRSDRVMPIVSMFEEAIATAICAYDPQSGKTMAEEQRFYDELACERNFKSKCRNSFKLG